VRTEQVIANKSAAVIRAPARVAFRDGAISRIGAPLSCRVADVHVRTGERVKKGDALIALNCPEAASKRAGLATAHALQREAKAAFERQLHMLRQGVSTERERLEAERSLMSTEAELTRAQAEVRFLGSQQGTMVVLRSPIAGTVVSRNATIGGAAEPGGEPLVEVGNPSELWVVADVFERDLYQIHEGTRVTLELPSVGETLPGHVVSIGALVEGRGRTAPTRIVIDRRNERLRPGMFGRAQLESSDAALALPTQAVLIKNGKLSVVYVQVGPTTFEERAVTTGQPVDGKVLITSGISSGDNVVIQGALLLDSAADQLL